MMSANPSFLRRVYDTAALFALLNVMVLGGLGAYLLAIGAVNGERLGRIGAVLRGDELCPDRAETPAGPEQAQVVQQSTEPTVGKDTLAEAQMDLEIRRRESERIKAELDQRLALNNSILLRVIAERERFQRELEEAARTQEAAEKQRREEGFRKQVAIYEALAPKIAVEHLLAMSDPDEAAKVLLEINTRKAKRIVEAAKRGDQLQKMRRILQRIREVAPDRSTELGQTEG